VCRVDVTDADYDKRFLTLALQGYLDLIWGATSATTVKHLSSKSIAEIPLPRPPLLEQRRIVAILEEHLTSLDAAESSLRSAMVKCDAAHLAALRLTRRNTAGADCAPLGSLADTSLGKMLDSKKQTGTLTPYLRNINVRWGSFDLTDVQETLLTPADTVRLELLPGDLLLCEGGEPGRCAIWRESGSRVAFQKALHRVRVRESDQLDVDFLALMIEEGIRTQRWADLFTGTTIKHLPQEKLRLLDIPVPPMGAQKTLVDDFRRLDEALKRSRTGIALGLSRSTALRSALLAAAFSGRLTGRASDSDVIETIADQEAS